MIATLVAATLLTSALSLVAPSVPSRLSVALPATTLSSFDLKRTTVVPTQQRWAYAETEFRQDFVRTLARAAEVASPASPRVAVVQYTSGVALSASKSGVQEGLVSLRSIYPSLQAVVGLVVDGDAMAETLSVTFGGGVNARGFDIDSLSETHAVDQQWMRRVAGFPDGTRLSFMLFPSPEFAEQHLARLLDGIDNVYPTNHKIGGVLSDSLPSSEPLGYVVQWPSASAAGAARPQVKSIQNGLVGLVVDSDVVELEQRWPWWQRSLIPMLRWTEFMGH
jgi:hypothetical protein